MKIIWKIAFDYLDILKEREILKLLFLYFNGKYKFLYAVIWSQNWIVICTMAVRTKIIYNFNK